MAKVPLQRVVFTQFTFTVTGKDVFAGNLNISELSTGILSVNVVSMK
jgi:hypothetical protein